ncbi:MAG TPA: hypothetical protein VF581_00460 [Flavobacterium sp.]|jgi:hypothetical protein
MKQLLTIVLFAALTTSCNEQNCGEATAMDNAVTIYLQDAMGNDLFETTDYESADFTTFYVINGEAIENNMGNLDHPKHFIMSETIPQSMMMFINDSANEQFPETIINWNDAESDTLRAQYRHVSGECGSSHSSCEKLWLNDVLVWDGTVEGQVALREVTIVK